MNKLILSAVAIAALSFASCEQEGKTAETVGKDIKNKTEKTVDAFDMKNTDVKPAMEKTSIKLNKTKHDFGTINEGDIVKTIYTVTNTGDKPLQLNKPKVSCGCTTPSYPKELIQPGKSADIEVQFNSTNKPNKQFKNVTLTGNFEGSPMNVSFTALVNPKDKTAGADSHAGHGH